MARLLLNNLLRWAARRGDPVDVQMLLEDGADAMAEGWWTRQPLPFDVLRWSRRYRTYPQYGIGLLRTLRPYVPVECRNRQQRTLLMAAVFAPLLVFDELLGWNIPLNARDGEGNTVLMLAARYGRSDLVRRLAALGADLNARNTKGETALMLAAVEGHIEVIHELAQAGAMIDAQDKRKRTALMRALYARRREAARVLRDYGASLEEPDDTYYTARDLAERHDMPEVLR